MCGRDWSSDVCSSDLISLNPLFISYFSLSFIGIAIDISIVISSVAESVATTIFISVIF